jgi:hypothetical protein
VKSKVAKNETGGSGTWKKRGGPVTDSGVFLCSVRSMVRTSERNDAYLGFMVWSKNLELFWITASYTGNLIPSLLTLTVMMSKNLELFRVTASYTGNLIPSLLTLTIIMLKNLELF